MKTVVVNHVDINKTLLRHRGSATISGALCSRATLSRHCFTALKSNCSQLPFNNNNNNNNNKQQFYINYVQSLLYVYSNKATIHNCKEQLVEQHKQHSFVIEQLVEIMAVTMIKNNRF